MSKKSPITPFMNRFVHKAKELGLECLCVATDKKDNTSISMNMNAATLAGLLVGLAKTNENFKIAILKSHEIITRVSN
jgi:hypothetical protein